MVTGKTKSGFAFEVDPEVASDMEFIETVADAMENTTKLPKMITVLLGAEQKKRLYDHVRGKNGRVKYDDIDREVGEIMEAINEAPETKN